jgi:hypothetical protein
MAGDKEIYSALFSKNKQFYQVLIISNVFKTIYSKTSQIEKLEGPKPNHLS